MAELHALANPRIALTFRDGLAWSLFWPYRRPDQIVFAVLCLSLLALSAWNRDFGLGFWSLGLSSGFFYGVALLGNPARLALSGVPTEAVRRVLSQLVCSGAPLGLLLVAIFAMVFTQVVDPDVEPLLSRPAVVIEWGYVSWAIVLLSFLAIAGPLISLLKALLQASP